MWTIKTSGSIVHTFVCVRGIAHADHVAIGCLDTPNFQHVVAPLGLGSRTPMKIGYPGTNLASVQSPKMCTGLGDSARTRPLLDSARLGLGLCLDSARLGLGLCWTRLGSDSDLVDSTTALGRGKGKHTVVKDLKSTRAFFGSGW